MFFDTDLYGPIIHKAPAVSVLDESLACVLWYALRGIGNDFDSGEEMRSDADTYFVGSGADELFAGYARHRACFKCGGVDSVVEECEAELQRLGCRNGGRDARVATVLKKELRAPFLADNFVAWVNTLPMQTKCDLTLPRGVGEKLIVRQVLAHLGAPHNAPKQAMQFGSGYVKLQEDKTLKASACFLKHFVKKEVVEMPEEVVLAKRVIQLEW
uniref:Asparagine synthetase domain-containing protein n=1 Tax=Angiostrongylus cantonensis TaxID=6313 RepID=A0A0K0DIY6_ANGCA